MCWHLAWYFFLKKIGINAQPHTLSRICEYGMQVFTPHLTVQLALSHSHSIWCELFPLCLLCSLPRFRVQIPALLMSPTNFCQAAITASWQPLLDQLLRISSYFQSSPMNLFCMSTVNSYSKRILAGPFTILLDYNKFEISFFAKLYKIGPFLFL